MATKCLSMVYFALIFTAMVFCFLAGDTPPSSMAVALCALPHLGHPPWLPHRASQAADGLAHAHCWAATRRPGGRAMADECSRAVCRATTGQARERVAAPLPGKRASGPPRRATLRSWSPAAGLKMFGVGAMPNSMSGCAWVSQCLEGVERSTPRRRARRW